MFKQAKVDNAQPWSEWKTWHAISQTLLISLKQKSTMIAGSIFRIFILLSIQNFKAAFLHKNDVCCDHLRFVVS